MEKTILIVDDSPLCHDILKSVVKRLGYGSAICEDGQEAIRYLSIHSGSVAAVLLDIYMPQIDGISTLGHFRSNYPALPVIVISGSEDDADEKTVNALGAAGFIKKPLILASVHETIRGFLENWRG